MKYPIEWHEQCLVNVEIFLEVERKRLLQAAANVERLMKDVEFRKIQIAEARRKKKEGFDADKFLAERRSL